MVNRSRRPARAYIVGLVAILAGVIAVAVAVAVIYIHHPQAVHEAPHIKVRIGNWHTRHIGRWT